MIQKVIYIVFCLMIWSWGVQAAETVNNKYDCFELAGRDANIDPMLLRAVAWQESGLNYRITGSNALAGFGEGYGYGLMQIDSQHLLFLKKYGITKENLISDICLNIYVGAYIMAVAFNKFGENWRAVGAYNAGFKENSKQQERRTLYARKVHATYQYLKKLK
ncbi:lytic transglycosylase [Salmonella enterica subsp. enterica serovar Ibadan]|uniref:Transglycosylase SLT domain-containing protein n=4 Tax=Salmonella enterica TaxID=28901 RepID=A0A762GMK3_SALER|nr:lytic transglycosylase [Salmonella enterica subsp. enterica serovar Agama]EAA8812340.1 lytic transglycosylase [Salmonella enterica subsp. enterica]EAB8247017.1 lytic transglycosylase [Salmonella enterica subsp. enterica serovar Typhimurium]EAC0144208.1 lytic transglycosylase [Salmonella enterica subsp. enterica serovar Ajiobo]EBH9101027.1 lytic transglycosylase [Salmonella enterica subsp. enterica serovar Colindale]EBI9251617.1 lytic transglycosylase [Salmonella enterica]EBQ6102005.1 lytic